MYTYTYCNALVPPTMKAVWTAGVLVPVLTAVECAPELALETTCTDAIIHYYIMSTELDVFNSNLYIQGGCDLWDLYRVGVTCGICIGWV